MGDDPSRPPWPSRLTPISSRAVITQGAKEIAVDDFIDSHLRERPRTVPEMSAYQPEAEPPTHRRVEPGVAPAAPAPPPGWAPAAPPRPGNAASPYQPSVKTIPMQAVAAAPRPAPPPAPPPPSHDDEGGGRTMMLTPEQAEAAARALAAATAAAAPRQATAPAPAPPPTGLSGTIMMEAIGPAPPMPPPVPPPAPAPAQMPSYITPAVPQGPAPAPLAAQPAYEPFPEPTYVPPKKGGAGIFIGVGVAIAVVAGLGVAYWKGLIGLPIGGSSSPKSTAAATSEPTSAPAASTASAAAAPGPSAAPSDATSAGAPPAPPAGDDKPLLSFEGALTVTSSIDAEVVVQGQSAGRTNKRLVTRCGPKNVRLRVEGKGWVSPGQPVHITCMQSTSVTIDPSS